MLAYLLLGYLLGIGSIVVAASIRRYRTPAQQRDREFMRSFRDGDR